MTEWINNAINWANDNGGFGTYIGIGVALFIGIFLGGSKTNKQIQNRGDNANNIQIDSINTKK